MNFSNYLGKHVSTMLAEHPFKDWSFERSVEMDLEPPIAQYVFGNHGLALQCDQDEKISVIFLFSDKYDGFDESLMEFPFSWKREQVVGHFGTPTKGGGRMKDPILGEYGGWDRFDYPNYTVHIEYRPDSDRIKMVTLMRPDVTP